MTSCNRFFGQVHANDIKKELISNSSLPFSEILSESKIEEAISRHCPEFRDRVFSPSRTLWTLLSQVLEEDQSCQNAVIRFIFFLISQGKEVCSSNNAAYCKARARLPEELLQELALEGGKELEKAVPENWLWRKRHLKLVDGSTLSLSDTGPNQKAYPQTSSQKEGLGFPLCRVVGVLSLATGAILNFAIGAFNGSGNGEPTLLRQMMNEFEKGDIVVADRCYCSYWMIAQLMQQGVDCVLPMNATRKFDFRKGKKLGKKDHLVEWEKPKKPEWMDEKTYESMPEAILLRETEIEIERPGFKSQKRTLVTTLLNSKDVSKEDLAFIADQRWIVELDIRAIKQTMKMAILRAKTPSMVRKEIWAHLLAYNQIRKVMAQSAITAEILPRKLSFKKALQIVSSARLASQFIKHAPTYINILKAISNRKLSNPPNRIEPRCIKRRPKQYPFLGIPRKEYQYRASQVVL